MSKEDLHELIYRCLQQSQQYDDKEKARFCAEWVHHTINGGKWDGLEGERLTKTSN